MGQIRIATIAWDKNSRKVSESFWHKQTGKKHGKWSAWSGTGVLLRVEGYNNGLPHGTFKDMDATGKTKTEANYKNGKRHRMQRRYSGAGVLSTEASYKDGFLHGLMRNWYDTGKLRLEYPYKDGKKHGTSKEWTDTGQQTSEVTYRQGKEVGIARKWSAEGMLTARVSWKDGVKHGLTRSWSFSANGTRFRNYDNGKSIPVPRPRPRTDISMAACASYTIPGGKEYTQTSSRGNKSTVYFLDEETMVGYREWYPNGKLRMEVPFKEGLRHGMMKYFSKTGEPESFSTYRFGEPYGLRKRFHKGGGKLFEEVYIKNNRWHGVCKSYDTATGKVYSEKHCKDGEVFIDKTFDTKSGKPVSERTYDLTAGTPPSAADIKRQSVYGHWANSGRPIRIKRYDRKTGNLLSDAATDANGKIHGVRKTFNSNGKPSAEEEYVSGIRIRYKRFQRDGDPESEEVFDLKGRKHGVFRTWFCSKQKKGKLASAIHYANGQLHGPYKKWDQRHDTTRVEGAYENGKKVGPWTLHSGGLLMQESAYVNGKREGLVKDYWHNHGRIKHKTVYKDGRVEGTSEGYDYKTGKVTQRTLLKDGNRHGPDVRWDVSGKIYSVLYFYKGRHVGEK